MRSTTTMPAASVLRNCTGKLLRTCLASNNDMLRVRASSVALCSGAIQSTPHTSMMCAGMRTTWSSISLATACTRALWTLSPAIFGYSMVIVCLEFAVNVSLLETMVRARLADNCCTPKPVQEIAAIIEDAQGDKFLRELKLRWDNHNKSMHMIRDILMVSCHAARVQPIRCKLRWYMRP